MSLRQAALIQLTDKQHAILERMANGTHIQLHFKERAKIILAAYKGLNNTSIAKGYGLNRNTVKKWRNRWAKEENEIMQIEIDKPHKLKSCIETVLSDQHRSGKPAKFTPEQVAHIISLSCKTPESLGLPLSHWTPSALRIEVINNGIIESISVRQVGRFLKRRWI